MPVKEHPYESGKTDFLVRGACAELLLILRSAERSNFDLRDFENSLSRWCLLYKEESHPSIVNMVKMAEKVRENQYPDPAAVLELSDLAEAFLG